jgi:Holliday junction resolvasome RuvABC endonuclease subunit
MVRILTGLSEDMESEDVSDALAVAICHATCTFRTPSAAAARRVAGGVR